MAKATYALDAKAPKSTQDHQTQKQHIGTRHYASKVFKESSLGIVSSFANTISAGRRMFKIVAFFLCLSCFLYQSTIFLLGFFSYPTSMNFEMAFPSEVEAPAYTFCDNNGISRRLFCEKYPDRCEVPDQLFCKKYESYCGENSTRVPKKEYFNVNSKISKEEMIQLNVHREDFVENNSTESEGLEPITGPYLRRKDVGEPSYLCYSLNDRVNSPLEPRTENTSYAYFLHTAPFDILNFNVKADDMFLPGNRPGIWFSVHSQYLGSNPFNDGVFMEPGKTYKLSITMEEDILLEEPYSRCMNYTKLWESNGRTGPRTQEMCTHKCYADLSLQCFGCISAFIRYPSNETYCFEDEEKNLRECYEDPDIFRQFNGCYMGCRGDCRYVKYKYTIQEKFKADFDEFGNTQNDSMNTIRVEIVFGQEEVLIVRHLPKYMFVEAFSMIGGFIGIWLGINFLDIADIFEGFCRITRYILKKK